MKAFFILTVLWVFANGKSLPSERIIGGSPASIEEAPYQVALLVYMQQNCGGSIISAYWVITAAHCLDGYNDASPYSVRVGSAYWRSGGSWHQGTWKVVHPQWKQGIWSDYDYALLKVGTPMPIGTSTVNTIPLASWSPAGGIQALVTGWGQDSARTDWLRKVQIPIVDHEACANANWPSNITPRMLCAGPFEGGRGSCYGDSGGPLVVGGQLVGLVSWAQGCAQPGKPTMFADVANQREWIRGITGI